MNNLFIIKSLSTTFLLIIVVLSFACNKPSNTENEIVGKWVRSVDVGQNEVMNFSDSGKYVFEVHGENNYPGQYSIVKDTINLVDTYCGTKLPGKYTIKFRNADTFNLSLIDDKFCGRKNFFPSEWVKIK